MRLAFLPRSVCAGLQSFNSPVLWRRLRGHRWVAKRTCEVAWVGVAGLPLVAGMLVRSADCMGIDGAEQPRIHWIG